jgi:Family of unknown function (DUF6081)
MPQRGRLAGGPHIPMISEGGAMRSRASFAVLAMVALTFTAASGVVGKSPNVTTVVYDDFTAAGGYTLATYATKWSNIYGLGDMGAGTDTRDFSDGTFAIADAPFRTSFDFSVFDHLKYIAISNSTFAVPTSGSLTFSSDIAAQTPGTEVAHVVHGTYGPPFSYPVGAPYSATVLQGQQAGAVMNMVSFETGQLFDWFISGDRAFALIERLPSSVTGNTTDHSSPDWVGPEKMYTQIIVEVPAAANVTHHVSITYTRGTGVGDSTVEYFLDGSRVAKVKNVGVPLDRQPGQKYTGIYPSLGAGEDLRTKLDSFAIGHGTFSLLDAFPFQWCETGYPEACAKSVSIPVSERLFGQGVNAHFDNFTVTTKTNGG